MTKALLEMTRGMKSNKPLRLLELKQEGHDLIDTLVASGLSRSKVYNRLRKRTNRAQGREHFGKMHTIGEAQEAVDILATWLKDRLDAQERERNPLPSKLNRRKAQTLPWPEQQRLIREMRENPTHPSSWTKVRWWTKIKLWLTKTK